MKYYNAVSSERLFYVFRSVLFSVGSRFQHSVKRRRIRIFHDYLCRQLDDDGMEIKMKCADIKLGYSCNNQCIHCVIQNQKQRAEAVRGTITRPTEESKQEILKSFHTGCKAIIVTGGEPTIRSDFTEIVKYIKSLGMLVSVQSNGRKFSDKMFVKEAAEFIDVCVIALHGSTQSIHDRITRVAGSFYETMEGIRNLRAKKVKIWGKVVLSKLNYTDVLNIVKLFAELEIYDINIAFPHACENILEHYDEVVPRYDEIREHIENCIQYSESIKMNLDFETILPCALSRHYPINYFSDLKNNLDVELKQIDSAPINWNEIRKTNKKKLRICDACNYNDICEGYWLEYILLRGEKEFSIH